MVQVRLPDLVQVAVSNPPAELARGASFTVTDSVRNEGTIATASTATHYYLSVDTVRDTGDYLLTGTRSVAAVAAGATNSGSRAVTIPPSSKATTSRCTGPRS